MQGHIDKEKDDLDQPDNFDKIVTEPTVDLIMQNYTIMKMMMGGAVDPYYDRWWEIANLDEVPRANKNIQMINFSEAVKDKESIIQESDVEIEISPMTKKKRDNEM